MLYCNVSIATLGGPSIWKDSSDQNMILGGKKIGSNSGITLSGQITLKCVKTLAHEYGHYFFGPRHFNSLGKYSSMGGTQTMHAYEREKLGWIKPIILDKAWKDLVITDAILTSRIYRIPLDDSEKEYVYLENRQRSTYWDKIISDGDDECDLDKWRIFPETGLLITHVKGWKMDVQKPDQVNRIPYKSGQKFSLTKNPDSDSPENDKRTIQIKNIREVGEGIQDIIVDIEL